MIRAFRDLFLFFQRDLRIASTYRTPFVLEAVEALFGAALFYQWFDYARQLEQTQLFGGATKGERAD